MREHERVYLIIISRIICERIDYVFVKRVTMSDMKHFQLSHCFHPLCTNSTYFHFVMISFNGKVRGKTILF